MNLWHQPELHLALPSTRQLVTMATAMVHLDVDEDAVLERIEDGRLCYAFDLATAQTARREVRIWRHSLWKCARCEFQDHPELDEVLRTILPNHDRPGMALRARVLANRWTCSASHVHNLLAAGLISGEASSGPGRGHSPLVQLSSAALFLEKRRII